MAGEPVDRDLYNLSQLMNERFDGLEKTFGERMDSFEKAVKHDIGEMKAACNTQTTETDKTFKDIRATIEGTDEQLGLKGRIASLEGGMKWQWLAIVAGFGLTAFVQSQLWGHVTQVLTIVI